jgi:cell division protein FtsB
MQTASNHIIHMLAGNSSDSDDDPLIFDDYDMDETGNRTNDPVHTFRADPALIFRGAPDEEAPEVVIPQDMRTVKKAVSFDATEATDSWSANDGTVTTVGEITSTESVPNAESNFNLVEKGLQQESDSCIQPCSTHEPSQPVSHAGQSPESSPAAFTTSGVSEFSSRPPETAKAHSVITIEHTTATSPTSKSAAFLFGMSKPVFAVVAFVLLFTTISAIVFFAEFLRIPGLDNQIAALTSQVDRLEAEVQELQTEINRLTSEVDRLELEVDDLSLENDRLVVSNDRLEAQNSAFSDFVQQLNGTNIDIENWIQNVTNTTASLSLQVAQLTDENEALQNSTVFLENEVADLQDQADVLNRTNMAVEATNAVLETQVDNLNAEILSSKETNNLLMNQNYRLNTTVATLSEENAGLKAQIDRLETVLTFLNESGNNGTFPEVVQELNNLIESNQNLMITSLQNQYLSRVDFWLCSYMSEFSGRPFVVDPTLAIGATSYSSVIANVNSGALVPLCLNRSNFEDFMKVNFLNAQPGLPRPYNVSTNKLRSAVTQYTTRALNFYFPDNGEAGISPQDWAEANYTCSRLQSNLMFVVEFN